MSTGHKTTSVKRKLKPFTYDLINLRIGEVMLVSGFTMLQINRECAKYAKDQRGYFTATQGCHGISIKRITFEEHSRSQRQVVSLATLARIEERLRKLEDALRFVSILVIRIDRKLNELGDFADDPKEREHRELELKDFKFNKQ